MKLIVPRTCTDLLPDDEDPHQEAGSRPLEVFRGMPAYVLLGDPGAGKTTAFKTECKALGDEALRIPARELLTLDPDHHPEWRDKTLFIDGLDEVRAGSPDPRTPFDAIRTRLDQLGQPRFRLSCRSADWRSENDYRHLASVTPQDSQVTVLQLDPLTDSDVARIIDARSDIPDAEEFINQAQDNGVHGFLENPLSLDLLARVVAHEGSWPSSRLELFDKACSHIVGEHNEGHKDAAPQPPSPDLLDAAGRLSALLLISGGAGYSLQSGQVKDDFQELDQCDYNRPELLRRACSTKLFAAESQGRVVPVHRHIAEFVGARHLARVIDDGLPARRVIALLTGEDGVVVGPLRGLSAWLAAVCTKTRPGLIQRDPIGVTSYGDISGFTTREKETLLKLLHRESSRLKSATWTASTIGAVVTPGMEPVLRAALESRNDGAAPEYVAFVFLALTHGTPLASLASYLFDIVYDNNRWRDFYVMALDAFLHCSADPDATISNLKQLLGDLSAKRVPDSDHALLATVLRELYPNHVRPSHLLCFLVELEERPTGLYRRFWESDLSERSSNEDIAELLDAFVTQRNVLQPALERNGMHEVPVELLARGIESWGETIPINRLCDWLRLGIFPKSGGSSCEAVQRIAPWLGQHPAIQKAVVEEYVTGSAAMVSDFEVQELLFGSRLPPDFGLWCLGRARRTKKHRAARFYLGQSCRAVAYREYDSGLSLESLLEGTQNSAQLQSILQSILVFDLWPEYLEQRAERQSYLLESERKRRTFVALVREHVDALRENRCGPGLLHQLGLAYLGLFADVEGDSPEQRLSYLFGDDQDLIDATLNGLRGTPMRDDIPDPCTIIGLLKTSEEYLIGVPFLVGVDELDDLRHLSDRQLRQALAFQFCTPVVSPRNREARLLSVSSEAAAEVLVQCVTAKVRNGGYEERLVPRLSTEDYAEVARYAVLPLLRAFPPRTAQPQQIAMLDELLLAALRWTDRTALSGLVAEKLTRKTMRITQRVHWLVLGAVVDPGYYLDCLRCFAKYRQPRVAQAADVLYRDDSLIEQLPTSTLALLIELLGSTVARWKPSESDTHTLTSRASHSVYKMIQTLADRPTREASDELEKLAANPALGNWQRELEHALDRQRVLRREADYRHPTVAEVCQTLNGGTPGNAGDLAALVADRLHELATRIRTENTDDWRQYWNLDQHERAIQPRPENACRDALLSDLRQVLPKGVDAQPEGQYANDKRADIRVGYQGFQVPVEVKRNKHRDLWSAPRNQLIAQYTRDPDTNGYGIYLVFWFGADLTQPPPSGTRPACPDELQDRLEGALTEDQRRKISVVVIDVSSA